MSSSDEGDELHDQFSDLPMNMLGPEQAELLMQVRVMFENNE